MKLRPCNPANWKQRREPSESRGQPPVFRCLLPIALALLCGCQTAPVDESGAVAEDAPEPRQLQAQATAGEELEMPGVQDEFTLPKTLEWSDLDMLMSMSFDEAAALSAESMEVGQSYRVAADQIEVVARNRAGVPTRVVASGKVFVELRMDEIMVALAESAEVGGRELVLRGRPLLGRGESMLAGLSSETVFTVTGDTLRVAGEHEVLRRDQLVERREQLLAAVASSEATSRSGASSGASRSYRIDQEFDLPPLPSATEKPDLILLSPPPELPEMDEELALPEIP